MSSEISHSRDFSNDKLYMWRTVVAIAHIDGHVCEDERGYLEGVLDRMRDNGGLDDDRYSILRRDLTEAQDALEMLSHVEDPKYRGQILYFAHLLANKDGNICEAEQDLIDKLEDAVESDAQITSADREALNKSIDTEDEGKGGSLMQAFERLLRL